MTAYVKKGGKRFDASGGKSGFAARGPKKDFAKKGWGDNRSDDRPKTFHKAICSNCGKECEVPFKPVNGKPIFCRDCFVKTGDTAGGRAGDRFPKRDYNSARPSAARSDSSNTEVLKQLELMNAKLERLIQAVEQKQ